MNWVTDGIWRCSYLHWFILFCLRTGPISLAMQQLGVKAFRPRNPGLCGPPLPNKCKWSWTPSMGRKWHTSNRLWKLICSDQSSLKCRLHWRWINCDLLQSTSFVSRWRFNLSNHYATSMKTHSNSCCKIHSNLCFTWSNIDRKMLSMFQVINYDRVETVIEIHIFDVSHYGLGDLDLNWRQNNRKQKQHVHITVVICVCYSTKCTWGLCWRKFFRTEYHILWSPWTYINTKMNSPRFRNPLVFLRVPCSFGLLHSLLARVNIGNLYMKEAVGPADDGQPSSAQVIFLFLIEYTEAHYHR